MYNSLTQQFNLSVGFKLLLVVVVKKRGNKRKWSRPVEFSRGFLDAVKLEGVSISLLRFEYLWRLLQTYLNVGDTHNWRSCTQHSSIVCYLREGLRALLIQRLT